ncbi:MAG: Hsp20 family protein [Myxococcota bacterium]|nr:Hsp20 family protein [Myxococcota bacterium]
MFITKSIRTSHPIAFSATFPQWPLSRLVEATLSDLRAYPGTERSKEEESSHDEQTTTVRRRPAYSVNRTKDQLSLEVELPGVEQDALSLQLVEDELQLSAELPARQLRYALSLQLSDQIDQTSVSAEMNAGLLQVTLPYKSKPAPRVISIGSQQPVLEEA